MADHSIGRIFAEINLDPDPFNKGLARLKADAGVVVLGVEKNFQTLGIRSAEYFNLSRAAAENAYQGIKNSATATANDIVRAEEARNARLTALNMEQYGKQTSMLASLKANWIALTASAVAAWATVSKGMEYIEIGAKAQQAEESFRMVAESSKIAADSLLANLDRAAAGTVDDSDLMQEAVKGMVLGLNEKQLVTIMENARLAARYAGTDVKTAFADITNAIATDMPRALKQYGLITREETAQIQAALADGAKDVSLYDLAMAHAAVNTAKFAAAQRNAAEAVQVYHATMNQAQENLGKSAIGAFQKLMAASYTVREWGVKFREALGIGKPIAEAEAELQDLATKKNAILGIMTIEEKRAEDARKITAKANLDTAEKALKLEQDKVKAAADAARDWKKNQEDAIKLAKDNLAVQQSLIDMQVKSGAAARAASLGMYLGGMTSEQRAAYGPTAEMGGAYADLESIRSANDAKIAAIEKSQAAIRAILQGSVAQNRMTQREYTDQVKQMEAELTQAKLKGLADYQSALTSTLSKAVSDYAKYTADVQKLDKEIADAKRDTADMIAGIKQAGMTPAELAADKERRANEALTDALERTGQDRIDALRKVQAAYRDLGMEAAKSSADQKEAAKQAWATDRPMDDWRTTAGKHSEAFKQFWSQTTPGGAGSAEWWAGQGNTYWGPSEAAKASSQTMAQKVQQVGDLIVQAQEKQRAAANDAANQADRMVSAMTSAADEAQRLANALASAASESASAAAAAAGGMDEVPKRLISKGSNPYGDWETYANVKDSGYVPGVTGVTTIVGGEGEGYAEGGVVPGPIGMPRRAIVHGGEVVLNQEQQSGGATILIQLDGRTIAQAVKVPMQDLIRAGQIQIRAN